MRNGSTPKRLTILLGLGVLALVSAGAALGGVARQATATKVTVTFTNGKLGVSSTTLDAGTTTFVVVNKGKSGHVLAISGPGLKGVRTSKLAAGHKLSLTVKLVKGSYMLSDPSLGAYDVQYLSIIPASTVSGTGSTNVPAKPTAPYNSMCGAGYTP